MTFDDSKFSDMAERIFREKGFNATQLASPEGQALIAETFGVLRNAISSAITQEVPEILTYALENNAFVFSGFKTFHALREVGLSLTNPDGSIKPFERFLNDVQTINNRYNHNYLRAEYNQAVAASQMAVRWHEFEKNGNDYYLQYRTAADSHVREEHAILHNTTLPIDDPFWNSFLPPNGWNCRCTAVQVRKSKYPMSDPELAMRRGLNCTDGAKRQIFRFNPGKSMRLYPERHPYFPKGCGNCDKRLNLAFDAKSEKCKACEEINRQKRIAINRKKYEELKNNPDYKDVEFDNINGGLKAMHIGHNWKHDKNDSTKFFENLTKEDLELACQNNLYRMGHRAILRNESLKDINGDTLPALDLDLDSKVMDIASITSGNYYGHAILRKNKQLGNVKKKTGYVGDSLCLYFHDAKMFSYKKIENAINYYKGKLTKLNKTQRVKYIYCVINEAEDYIKFEI